MKLIDILVENNITFIQRGKNVSKNHVAIHCPLCGEDDPSEHCNVNLITGYFRCWRNADHRGSFNYLMKLLRLSPVLFDFEEKKSQVKNKGKFSLPKIFVPIEEKGLTRKFFSYLVSRGFPKKDVSEVVDRYQLGACLSGEWQKIFWDDRIIMPIFFNYEIVSFTSRAIGNDFLRYRECPSEIATIPTSGCLYNFDEAALGGKKLFIVEGPFDCMKIDFYSGKDIGCVALFTNQIKSRKQVGLLLKLVKNYNIIIVLLDKEVSLLNKLELKDQLGISGKPIEFADIPQGFKDPGEFDEKTVKEVTNV